MSSGRIELTKLTSSNQPISFFYWVQLLTLFEKFQAELDIDDVRRLVNECERCRIELNKKITDKIETKDVNPDIYTYLEILEANKKEKHNKESLPTENVAVAQ